MEVKLNESATANEVETDGIKRRPKAPFHTVMRPNGGGMKVVDATGKTVKLGAGPAVGRPRGK
jgi:hypothetical protein